MIDPSNNSCSSTHSPLLHTLTHSPLLHTLTHSPFPLTWSSLSAQSVPSLSRALKMSSTEVWSKHLWGHTIGVPPHHYTFSGYLLMASMWGLRRNSFASTSLNCRKDTHNTRQHPLSSSIFLSLLPSSSPPLHSHHFMCSLLQYFKFARNTACLCKPVHGTGLAGYQQCSWSPLHQRREHQSVVVPTV